MSIMQRGGGIASTVQATRELSFIHLRSKAEGLLKKMTAMGITTVEGKSGIRSEPRNGIVATQGDAQPE